MDKTALFRLSYGLFILTAREGDRDNGCIINTCTQLTDAPLQIQITVNKQNLTHDMIKNTGIFNVSVLTEEATFWIFRHYGFQSGRDVDKFAGLPEMRTENGLRYAVGCTNAVLSGQVVQTVDCGTHTLFIARVTEARQLDNVPSCTYQYYFDHIKPKPPVQAEAEKETWVCKICGYVHEGPLPEGFICPWCKHGTEVFEKQ